MPARDEEDALMAGKQGGSAASRAISTLAGVGAAFAARKLLSFAWKSVTGKAPPEHPEDPQVALGEALLWGVAVGAAVGAARLLATRATTRRPAPSDTE